MTKQQLLNTLNGYSASGVTIDAVGTPVKFQDSQFGDKFYMVNIRKTMASPDRINYENVIFVVVNEGLSSEKAYFYKTAELRFDNLQEQGNITGL